MTGTLFVVATPIGNLEDLTQRAARVLAEVDLVAAENTKTAAKLLRHLEIRTKVVPYNDRNKGRTTAPLIAALRDGQRVALISDAGTPGISDPGQDLVDQARQAGATVVPLPGPSAVATLLSAAGSWGRGYRMIGFLPRKSGPRRAAFEQIASIGEPTVLFESPHRIGQALDDLASVLPEAHLVVGRELTKLHEEIWTGSPAEAITHFTTPRGEFALLVIPPPASNIGWSDQAVIEALREQREAGTSHRDAASSVARDSGRPRRQVYALWHLVDLPGEADTDGQ